MLGFRKKTDFLREKNRDPCLGSYSPDAYVKIFDRRHKNRKIKCFESSVCQKKCFWSSGCQKE